MMQISYHVMFGLRYINFMCIFYIILLASVTDYGSMQDAFTHEKRIIHEFMQDAHVH